MRGSSEENGRNLLAALAPDAEWAEAAGLPYADTYNATGKSFSATFARLYELKDGKIARMDQYADSAVLRAAME